MDINEKVKTELEGRIKKIEDLIASKGIGSERLTKARKVQRNVNLAVFLGGLFTFAGVVAWLLSGDKD